MRSISFLLSVIALAATSHAATLKVLQQFPHNDQAFTQGFIIDNGVITETTGRYGYSNLYQYHLGESAPDPLLSLANNEFGEGLTQIYNQWYWLTWKAGKAYRFDASSHILTGEFNYHGQGWGITHNGSYLITSDGTDTLSFRDPKTFELIRTITVRDGGRPVTRLNELEWVRGFIYANIWQQDRIVKIDPSTGQVVANFNMAFLRNMAIGHRAESLNGIAYDNSTDKLYITGKYWRLIFEVYEASSSD